jgi:hypothetical protein
MTSFEPLFDHRARLEQMQFEAAARRDRALIDKRSPENSPEVRVRIWERLHQVRLPKDPAHPVMARVAEVTGLDLAEVLEVQRFRAQPVVVA